ncbi:sigma-70 family RNA polymerase sigma factor [Streptomyces sp. B1866]|uniref:sigma-70 family RNA polymerase sigma factor n=1 Tax=Streptomyces sp. B1866 TaxID=3075431 RepID=UPI0028911A4D|nr:sigma-70 family RNA polymerase sigma factor [Streptomyces sp. B1866]MDT3400657.1 sigma-70 family RNA polymerase sigma factor [Streptomyces sp. B1866]
MIEIQGLGEVGDPADRARRAGVLIDEHQAAILELSRMRREALEEMLSGGMTQAHIAEKVGMTRARVGQLLSSGPRPERIFLGSGPLTVALGGKREAEKPKLAVSAEMLASYECISEIAQSLNLKVQSEVVPPPGMVKLNRPNLIVLGSPRILPFVGQVLESDEILGFESGERGWYLLNRATGEEFHSPVKDGRHEDYAYIGRLPRPDGRGTFLYIAGIHGPGTLGAVRYLEGHLEALYREVKTRRFSLIIHCVFGQKTGELETVKPVTQLYRHEGVS